MATYIFGIAILASWIIVWLFFFFARSRTAVPSQDIISSSILKNLSLATFVSITVFYALLFTGVEKIILERWISILDVVGLWLVIGGHALLIRARFALADRSAYDVIFSASNRIIKTGPYAYIRHPMYTGIFLSLLGSAILFRSATGFLFLTLIIIPILMQKALREERVFEESNPEAYKEYSNITGRFLPRW